MVQVVSFKDTKKSLDFVQDHCGSNIQSIFQHLGIDTDMGTCILNLDRIDITS